jgi:DNA-binding PucR family transcriptional regulator
MAVTSRPHVIPSIDGPLGDAPVTAQFEALPDGTVSSDELAAVLTLVSAALASPDICVVWRWTSQAVVSRTYIGTPPEELQPARWLALSRRPIVSRETKPDVGGHIILPVPTGEAGLAAAIATRPSAGVLPPDAVALLAPAMQMIAHQLRATQPRLLRLRAYEALVQIGTQIQAEQVHADAIFKTIVDHARDLLATDVAWLGLMDAAGERMRLKVAAGATTEEFMQMEVDAGTGIGGLALEEGRAVAVQDVGSSELSMPPSVAASLQGEGVRSVLCAPMSRDGSMIGSLYVGSRELTEFSAEATSLLCALASQAAVAIENARLYQALADKHDTLERSFAIHRMLTDASLSGAGLDAIASELTRVLERDLILTIEAGSPRSNHYGCDGSVTPFTGDEDPHALPLSSDEDTVAIMAGAAVLGSLRAVGDQRLTPLQRKALEHGGTVIALELVKEQAALEVEWRMQAELLDELVRCTTAIPDSLLARAQRAGIDLGRERCIAVLAPDEDGAASRLLETARHTLRCNPRLDGLITRRGDHVVVAIAAGAPGEVRAAVRELQNRARLAGVPASCGLGRPRPTLAAALREAEAALGLAIAGRSGSALVGYEELGPMRFILDAPDNEEMVALVHDVLGPLAEHDRERGSELMVTLRAYLASGGHHPTTCATCHIHVSTLKYRLSRIAAILDCSLTDPATRFQLNLAFEILRVLEMVDLAPFGG